MKTRTSFELRLGLLVALLALLALGACARTATPTAAELSTLSTCTATVAASLRESIGLDSACAFITVTSDGTLTSGQLVLDKNRTITGPDGGRVTIDGNDTSRTEHRPVPVHEVAPPPIPRATSRCGSTTRRSIAVSTEGASRSGSDLA